MNVKEYKKFLNSKLKFANKTAITESEHNDAEGECNSNYWSGYADAMMEVMGSLNLLEINDEN